MFWQLDPYKSTGQTAIVVIRPISNAGTSAGGHFNPTDQPHGRQDAKQRHVGGLGPIEVGRDGKTVINIRDSVITSTE